MTIEQNIQLIIEEFDQFDDWMDKYNYLIDMGKSIPLIDESKKTENNLINGCQSRVWLYAEYIEGKVYYTADSDAVITKGIANLLIRIFTAHKPTEIVETPIDFIDSLGLKEHLSPTRSNGLVSMIKQLKLYALAYQIKEKEGKL